MLFSYVLLARSSTPPPAMYNVSLSLSFLYSLAGRDCLCKLSRGRGFGANSNDENMNSGDLLLHSGKYNQVFPNVENR
jgi:hypothetical protein